MSQGRKPSKLRVLSLASLLGVPFALLLGGGLYACSGPSREATRAFFEEVRKTGRPPYPLDPVDAADATATLDVIAKSADFTVWNFQERGRSGWTRTCLFGRLSLPEGGRWLEVALEKSGDKWLVRDVSFARDCDDAKQRGDMRLK